MSKPATSRQVRTIFAFAVLYTALAAAIALYSSNGEFMFYIVVMVVLAGSIAAVHRRVGLSSGILWGLAVWGLLHMAGGLVPVPQNWQIGGPVRVLYSLWIIPNYLKYDHVVHFYGFGITTWLCWQALTSGVRRELGSRIRPTLGMLTLCAAAGMGFGAFNEVVEFIATLTMEETNVGDYPNTGWDLVSNLAGCIVAALIIRAAEHKALETNPVSG